MVQGMDAALLAVNDLPRGGKEVRVAVTAFEVSLPHLYDAIKKLAFKGGSTRPPRRLLLRDCSKLLMTQYNESSVSLLSREGHTMTVLCQGVNQIVVIRSQWRLCTDTSLTDVVGGTEQ